MTVSGRTDTTARIAAAGLDWLTPEELRAMDKALLNTLELQYGEGA